MLYLSWADIEGIINWKLWQWMIKNVVTECNLVFGEIVQYQRSVWWVGCVKMIFVTNMLWVSPQKTSWQHSLAVSSSTIIYRVSWFTSLISHSTQWYLSSENQIELCKLIYLALYVVSATESKIVKNTAFGKNQVCWWFVLGLLLIFLAAEIKVFSMEPFREFQSVFLAPVLKEIKKYSL